MSDENILRIGTRESPLAMWQAEYVRDRLTEAHKDLTVELVPIKTKGDKILDVALSKVGGKGLFVKELEVALLDGRVDICVHSTKDMPAELPGGLGLVAFPPRADPCDALVRGGHGGLAALPHGAKVGTSSLRRQAQILAVRPDIEIVSVRGNIQTRMKKVEEMGLSCVVLACAGIDRMAAEENIGHRFTPDEMLPAAAQGILSIEARLDDEKTLALLEVLDDAPTKRLALAERAFLKTLGGGCQVPIAAYATEENGEITLRGLVARPDGRALVRGAKTGPASEPVALGHALGREVLGYGGRKVLLDIGLGEGTSSTDGPLTGWHVVVARDDAPDDTMSQALMMRGADVAPLPLMSIDAPEDASALENAVRSLTDVDVLAFTSAQAVERFFDRLRAAGEDLRKLPSHALVAAVGPATKRALLAEGAAVDVEGDAGGEGLAVAIAAAVDVNGKRVLFPRAEGGREELAEALAKKGANVDVVDAYRQSPRSDVAEAIKRTLSVARGASPAALVLTSAKRVEVLASVIGPNDLEGIHCVALGETTAGAAKAAGLGDIQVAARPTPAAVAAALADAPKGH